MFFINSVQPKCTVFIKSTVVYRNVLGLHIHSPLMNSVIQINFQACKLHSGEMPIQVQHFNLFFYCCSSTIVSISPTAFSSTQTIPTSHPQSNPLLALSMCPLYMLFDDSPPFPPKPPTSFLVTTNVFFISMSLVILCLLVCFVVQVPLIGGICLSLPGLLHLV